MKRRRRRGRSLEVLKESVPLKGSSFVECCKLKLRRILRGRDFDGDIRLFLSLEMSHLETEIGVLERESRQLTDLFHCIVNDMKVTTAWSTE